MSKIKSLILGSAAALVAATGAQAADLPVKAKAVQYVKICSLYGAGFYYIPGTDTCIKLGGYAQFDATINGSAHGQPAWNNSASTGQQNRSSDYFVTRTRTQLNIDTRTATEYGVVRTYWSSNFQHTSGDGPSSGVLTMDFGFIQFAGFTFGKAVSGFQTPWGASPANLNTSNLLGGYDNSTGITQIAYTWQFGNGVSAQVGVEDNRTINRAQLINADLAFSGNTLGTGNTAAATAISTGVYPNAYGGNVSPDIVGNIRIDQAAFTAQLSAAGTAIHGSYFGSSGTTTVETAGHPNDVWGFAVAGGIQLKNLPTGAGDKISLDAVYVDGATKYLIGGTTGNAFDSFSGGGEGFGGYNTFAVLTLADGIYGLTGPGATGKIEKTTGWGFRGGYEHNWSPNWQTSVFGSYSKIDYNTNATAMFCNRFAQAVQKAGVASVAGGANGGASFNGTCNPDFAIAQIGTRTAWTPVKNLTLSGEVLYTVLDQNFTGSLLNVPATVLGGAKPGGQYDYKDQGIWSGQLRVRRTW